MQSMRNPNLDRHSVESTRPPTREVDELVGLRPASWWTGRSPATCPGWGANGTLRALPIPDLARVTRAELVDYFDNGWTLSELLFAGLQGEQAFRRPPYHRLRHPLVFYYAHPATFYVNKLRLAGLLGQPVDEDFETLFQTGVDEMSWDDLSQVETDWPAVHAVTQYRRGVYKLIVDLLETHPALGEGAAPITAESPLWALVMGMEHERIHLELSSVLVRELPIAWVKRPPGWPDDHPGSDRPRSDSPIAAIDYPPNALARFEGASVAIGKPRERASFGWDNAYGERVAHVRPFRATTQLVSNGELHEMVRAGGYQERRFWSDEGWGWKSFRNAKWPTFWVAHGPAGLHQYRLRTMFDVVDMPWDWPAIVNFHEARAYAAWRRERDGASEAYRLITEGEHHALRDAVAAAPSGHPMSDRLNHGLAFGSEGPVDAQPATSKGAHDLFGNAWEWIEDHFHPLPGFRIHPLYDDFSTPCFDGKHQMILGGSFVSAGDETSVWARFHFRPHFFQHCGFRVACADDDDNACDAVRLSDSPGQGNAYETAEVLDQYMMLHYGRAGDAMPWAFGPIEATRFPQRCAALVIEQCARLGIATHRALDVGCAVGGATFELARDFDHVAGVDLSASFIGAATTLKETGHLAFRRHDEGELGEETEATVDDAIDRARASFRQADACALPADLASFDAVLVANLLCRIPSPRALLERMAGPRGIVRPGGLLVITSPYTWMDRYTPRDVWLGGLVRDGRRVSSLEGLTAVLTPAFELVESREMPLVIREHGRKFQYIVAHATVWRRRGTAGG
jgi:5-histidylcysteine sulfoxide synthase/putative 4-mercaptohistidine N1-methyltranferase